MLPKGEGEGEGEGKEPPNPLAGKEDEYPFSGQVARLNRRDYHAWRKQFHAIPDFDAELAAFDSWLTAQTEAKRNNWFGSAAPWLAKRHQESLERQRNGPKAPAVGV